MHRLRKVIAFFLLLVGIVLCFFLFRFHSKNITNSPIVNTSLEEVTLLYVIDGDTIIVKKKSDASEIKVRLLLIDAPESVHRDERRNSAMGVKASAFLKDFLERGTTLYLQYDEQLTDYYGRTLAYVWLSNHVDLSLESDIREYMLNALLMKQGYATLYTYPPNELYLDLFEVIYDEAVAAGSGLWSDQ